MNVRRWLADAQARADAATPGRWRVWAMAVMAGPDDNPDVDAAVDVAHTFCTDANGRPRTYDADFIAAARSDLPAALAAIRGVLQIADSLATAPGITDRATLAAALHGTLAGALLPTDGDHRG